MVTYFIGLHLDLRSIQRIERRVATTASLHICQHKVLGSMCHLQKRFNAPQGTAYEK